MTTATFLAAGVLGLAGDFLSFAGLAAAAAVFFGAAACTASGKESCDWWLTMEDVEIGDEAWGGIMCAPDDGDRLAGLHEGC